MVRQKGLDPGPGWPKPILLPTELDFRPDGQLEKALWKSCPVPKGKVNFHTFEIEGGTF